MISGKVAHKGAAIVIGVGAESGLGAALARRFAREGLSVTIGGRTLERLQAIAAQIKGTGGMAAPKVADATSEHDVAAIFDEADRDGGLELVAYNDPKTLRSS
jgi:NADP-dependent 3-hydroxy acid dehydrogenase YdfG